MQLLVSSHVRERDKALLRAIMVGGVWNGFLLSRVRGQPVPCRLCGAPDHDGHLFWECTFPPLVEIRENPEFHDLMRMDKSHWPRCLLRHGWLPTLSGVNGASPWAVDATESAACQVEVALGRYSSDLIADWELPGDFDHVDAAASLTDHPDVWTDGSLVLDQVTGISSSGSGFFAHQDERFWRGCRWGHVDGVHPDLDRVSCRGFSPVPTIQRAEMWGVVLALQTSRAVHLGVDNLGVFVMLIACFVVVVVLNPSSRSMMVTFFFYLSICLIVVVVTLFGSLRSKAMLMMLWFSMVKFVGRIGWVMMLLMRLLIFVVGGSVQPSLTLVALCLGSVVAGILLFLTFIVFSLLFLVLWSVMMAGMVLLLIPLFGLLVLVLRGAGWFMLFGIGLFCPGHLVFGNRSGFMFLLLRSVLRMLLGGLTLQVFW